MKSAPFVIIFLCSSHLLYSQFVPNPEMRGFADLHCHQMANHAFGGRAFVGKAFGPIKEALPWCDKVHGPGGTLDFFNTYFMRGFAYGIPSVGHKVGGFPEFDGWPRWDNISHQGVHEDWLFRAYEGGLRLMVMLAVHNVKYCDATNIPVPYADCLDKTAIVKQIEAAHEMEKFIDAKYGGAGKGWYRIVKSAVEAEKVIKDGKLAIVLGIETDLTFPCNGGVCTIGDMQAQIDEFYRMGVRHIFPIHFTNNTVGGSANDKISLATGITKLRDCSDYEYDGGKCNQRGLSPLGKEMIKYMMSKGMIVDIDHMSQIAKNEALGIAERYAYPAVVSGHSGFVEIAKGHKKHEGNLKLDEVNRIYQLGGMVAPILWQGKLEDVSRYSTKVPFDCGNSSQMWAQAYLFAKDKMPGRPIGIGSDFNGGIPQSVPRFGTEACFGSQSGPKDQRRVVYPFTAIATNRLMSASVIGGKRFDINEEGVAHVGMLPDYIADLQAQGLTAEDLEPLMNSAKYYVKMWKKAESVFQNSYDVVLEKGQTNEREIQVFGWGFNDYKNKYDELWAQGYRLSSINAYVEGNQTLYNAVWKSGNTNDIAGYALKFIQFKQKYDELWAQGMRLEILESYFFNGEILYNALWRPGNMQEVQVFNWKFQDFLSKRDELMRQGWRIHIFDSYSLGGERLYNAVWRQSNVPVFDFYAWAEEDLIKLLKDNRIKIKILQGYNAGISMLYDFAITDGSQDQLQFLDVRFSDFKAKNDELYAQGWRIRSIDMREGRFKDEIKKCSGPHWSQCPVGRIETGDNDIIDYSIERSQANAGIEFRLELGSEVTYWKAVRMAMGAGPLVMELECQDNVTSASNSIFVNTGQCINFKKQKAFGYRQSNNEGYTLCNAIGLTPGSKVTFKWVQD